MFIWQDNKRLKVSEDESTDEKEKELSETETGTETGTERQESTTLQILIWVWKLEYYILFPILFGWPSGFVLIIEKNCQIRWKIKFS